MDQDERSAILGELQAIRSRIDQLEKKLSPNVSFTETTQAPLAPATIRQPLPSQNFRIAPIAEEPSDFSTGKLLGIVGIICFVLASSFMIKLAVDSGWLTPERQLGMAFIFGFTLIGAGFWLYEKDIPYISLLPGTGIIVLNMCAYSGRIYYDFYSETIAALLATSISCLSLYLFKRFQHFFYVVVAIVGSYLSVFLFTKNPQNAANAMGFFVIWDLGFAILSIALHSRIILLLSAYLALGIFSCLSIYQFSSFESHEFLLQNVIFQAVQFLIFIFGVGFYSVRKKLPLTSEESWSYFPLLLFFYGIEYFFVKQLYPTYAPFIALCASLLIYCIYYFFKSQFSKSVVESESVFNTFLAVVIFHAFYLEYLPARFTPWFSMILMLGYLAYSKMTKPSVSKTPKLQNIIINWLVIVVVFINYWKVLVGHDSSLADWEFITLNFCFFGIGFFMYLLSEAKNTFSNWIFLLQIANLQALVGLLRIAKQLTHSSQFQGFLISILWGLYAIGILLLSFGKKDRTLARSSLMVFAVAAGKVLLIDVSSSSSITRVVCFMILGILFYAGGYIYRYIESWREAKK